MIEVGKAYRGQDGVVRWARNVNRRNSYHLRWLDEERNIWHNGGVAKKDTDLGYEVPAPQAGETVTVIGVMGTPYQEVVAYQEQ